jgi:hypothetical protein
MNPRTTAAIFAAGLIAGAIAVRTIQIGDATAAPFNPTTTLGVDAGFVTSFCVHRSPQPLPDGGPDVTFEGSMLVPETRSLPDGGTLLRTVVMNSGERCQLRGAAVTTAIAFGEGQVATCVRVLNQTEQ